MEIKEIFDYAVQNGLGVLCVIYMIHFQNTTLKEVVKTLGSINERLTIIETHIGVKDKDKEV